MNTKLNVVRFENTDILTTSVDPHANCVELGFTTDWNKSNYHVHPKGNGIAIGDVVKVGNTTYNVVGTTAHGNNAQPVLRIGADGWTIISTAQAAGNEAAQEEVNSTFGSYHYVVSEENGHKVFTMVH